MHHGLFGNLPTPVFGPRLSGHPRRRHDAPHILAAANDAPTAGNLQAYEIIIVRDAARKRQLAAAAWHQDFVAVAPVVLVFCANPDRNRGKYGERGARLYAVQDATIAVTYAQLAATVQGLGTCWVGAFDEGAVPQILNTPPGGGPWQCCQSVSRRSHNRRARAGR